MRRIHIQDGARFAYIDLYLDKAIYDRAPERFNATTVIPVMDELKINVSTARQELTIGGASPEAAQHLDIPCGAPVALVRRYACNDRGQAIYAAWWCTPATGCAWILIWCADMTAESPVGTRRRRGFSRSGWFRPSGAGRAAFWSDRTTARPAGPQFPA